MTHLTIDIALCLPKPLRDSALSASALLVERMRSLGHPSTFQLGQAVFADPRGGSCEPHVSLFMLQVERRELGRLLSAVQGVGAKAAIVQAIGHEWRHNPQGAPELHFHPSPEWTAVQQAVLMAAEAFRCGRLRETDPTGARLADVVRRLRQEDPNGQQLRQLIRYGYDEITDDDAARFNPHVTVAWPADGFLVTLEGLPPVSSWNGALSELGVYGMGPNGTCTNLLGAFPLSRNLTRT